ncbi:MAG: glycerophosphodiester phosphodiesterase family protein [Xanthomonadales bacterium]|nr:glycerophosphodiester phosphodiesterase family protein [Xanthomonadales bacterium]
MGGKGVLLALLILLPTAAVADALPVCPSLVDPTGAGQQRTDRPALLVSALSAGALRKRLEHCLDRSPERGTRTIGHRGAPLRYPEHTRESYQAAARLGAGVLECDVTATRDGELLCRHDACDLHRTTNLLETPLAARCRVPFQPAREGDTLATARCCTTDFDLAELKTLTGRHDVVDPLAQTVADYLSPEPPLSCLDAGTLLSHRESIALFQALGTGMAPELKSLPAESGVPEARLLTLADQLVDDYRNAGVPPDTLWLQTFDPDVASHWLANAGEYAGRVVWLDGRYALDDFDHRAPGAHAVFGLWREAGLQFLAPPVWMLVEAGETGPVPSAYARAARREGLRLLTWTLERSGPLARGGGWYYQTLNGLNPRPQSPGAYRVSRDADQLALLALLFDDLEVAGVFTDWAETTALVDRCLLREP